MDGAYITSHTACGTCNPLSSIRNALTIQGRPNIKCQVYNKSFDKSKAGYMPGSLVDKIIDFLEDRYQDPSVFDEAATSTFISCEQAVELQENIYNEGSKIIKVYPDGRSSCMPVERLFTPPWPTYILKVHPADGYGERFYSVDESDYSLWVLLSLSVWELWKSMVESVEDNIKWLGHWLRYAASALKFKVPKKENSWFKLKKKKEMISFFGLPLSETVSDFRKMKSLFSLCTDVFVINASSIDAIGEHIFDSMNKNVVICVDPTAAYDVAQDILEMDVDEENYEESEMLIDDA